jgi:hypothetical protein
VHGGREFLYFALSNGDLVLVDRKYNVHRFPNALLGSMSGTIISEANSGLEGDFGEILISEANSGLERDFGEILTMINY